MAVIGEQSERDTLRPVQSIFAINVHVQNYSVVHIIRIRLIRSFAYFEKTLGPTIETIQKIRMEKYG